MQNYAYIQKCYSNRGYMHSYYSFASNILLFFLSPSPHIFFSLVPLTLTLLISEASSLLSCHCQSPLKLLRKLTHRSDLQSSLVEALTMPPSITAEALFDQWVLGFWSFFILCLINFGILCLISVFWGFDPLLFFV